MGNVCSVPSLYVRDDESVYEIIIAEEERDFQERDLQAWRQQADAEQMEDDGMDESAETGETNVVSDNAEEAYIRRWEGSLNFEQHPRLHKALHDKFL